MIQKKPWKVIFTLCLITMIGISTFSACASTLSDNSTTDPISSETVSISSDSSNINTDALPVSLQQKLEKYPEAAEYVSAYPEEHNKHHNIDLSNEYTPGQIPLLIQWDVRWGYEMYGDDMMGINGCGPTCLSMVLIGLTGDTSMDPLTVAKFSEENGYYCNGSGTYWTLMSEGAQQLGLVSKELPLDESSIRSHLEAGQPIICAVGPGDFTTDGHFIVLTGENADGTIQIHDPNSRINSSKSWDLQKIMDQTNNLWAFSVS